MPADGAPFLKAAMGPQIGGPACSVIPFKIDVVFWRKGKMG